MTIKKLRPLPGEPVPLPRTPRCEENTSQQNEFQKQWRERRYELGKTKSVFQCTRPSVVKINDKHYCRLHGGYVVLTMFLEGKLVEVDGKKSG